MSRGGMAVSLHACWQICRCRVLCRYNAGMSVYPLSSSRIAALLPADSPVAVEVVQETGSTNADLLARVDRLPGPLLLVAQVQTAGRGRAGRSWQSAPGASLTFSLAWRFNRPVQALAGLPLAVGVALAQTLEQFGVPVMLKWPNDLWLDGEKLGGVLIETASSEGATWAVIGVGVNLQLPPDLSQRIGRPAAALPAPAGQDRDRLLAALAAGLAQVLEEFEREGFAAFAARWNGRHAWAGHTVQIIDQGAVTQEGVALGVDEGGRLLLETVNGIAAIVAGDVSLRRGS